VKFENLSVANEGMDDSLVLMKFIEEEFTLLPEKDVLGPMEDIGGDESKKKGVKETKNLLRTILSSLPVCRALKNNNLQDVLKSEQMVTGPILFGGKLNISRTFLQSLGAMDARDSATQVGECIRLLKSLPDSFRDNNFASLHDLIMQDSKKRNPYATYLAGVRLDLSMTFDHLDKQKDILLRTRNMYTQYYKAMRIHNHIEKKESEIEQFVAHFTKLQMLDEKAALVTQFLSKSLEVFSIDPFWKKAPPEERQEANAMMEKDFMCRIYQE